MIELQTHCWRSLLQDLPSSSSTLLSSLPAQSALPPLSTVNTSAPSFPSPGSIGSNSPLPSPVGGGGDLSPSQSLGLQGLSGQFVVPMSCSSLKTCIGLVHLCM